MGGNMFKIFEHYESKDWEGNFATKELAIAEIRNRFDSFYWMDKDNCESMYIELWDSETDTYEIYAMNCGGWLGCRDEDGPYRSEYFGKREEMLSEMEGHYMKPTELNPKKDYIIV